jgi:two-component system, chemotaxis family, protein-glutamate methylesterase/glutaminase
VNAVPPSGRQRAIAIGGSTGALPAVRTVLAGLSDPLAAPLFLALHIGSEGSNFLAELLGSAGRRQIVTAEEGQEVLDDVVYVAPVDHHLLVIDGYVRLGRGPRENLSRPAIDPLFRSVGASYGGGAIGVVLSGMLNDGAAGLADLKRCGGVAIAQNPTDALAPDMPIGALDASDVDHRGPAHGMPQILRQLISSDPGPDLPVSDAILLEIDIALGRPCLTEHIETIADPVALSCPNCGGVLSQLRTKPLRFRCQVGHAFSAEVLAKEQEGSLDEAIRMALRIVEERAQLVDRLARDSDAAGRTHSGRDFARKAQELREHAEVLRRAALQESG